MSEIPQGPAVANLTLGSPEFPPERPGTFRVGEVLVTIPSDIQNARAFGKEATFEPPTLAEIEAGAELPGRLSIVVDVYQAHSKTTYDGPENFIAANCGSFDKTAGLKVDMMGGTEPVRDQVSLGVLSRNRLLELLLECSTSFVPASPGEKFSDHNKRVIVDTIEQSIADRIAHGEEVTELEAELNQHRRERDRGETHIWAMPTSKALEGVDLNQYLEAAQIPDR